MLRSSARSSRTCRRKNWSFRFPFLTATAPGVPNSPSTKNVTWYIVVLAFPCLVFFPPLNAASALSLPFLVSAILFRLSALIGFRVSDISCIRHLLTVIDLRAAEEAEGGGLAGSREAEVVGDDHRAIDDHAPRLHRRRRRRAPELRAEGHLHRSVIAQYRNNH
ncbi:Os05g0304501 [Oryza sativa Japonica Group]|uniref:Os05g0304501 protein n=1 Tax=Oryza sativa subsp. japonica TaxID=39947 RepID=A0A0P0WKQ0_ORYSJ|nr:Os05g0304501 [Oryza sativa Japonica Group]